MRWIQAPFTILSCLSIGLSALPAMANSDDYQLDLGGNASIGTNVVRDDVYLNQYSVLPGKEVLTSVNLRWHSFANNGNPIQVIIWDDPNDDGDPHDAVVIFVSDEVVVGAGEGINYKYPAGGVFVGAPGDSFFIGVRTFGPGANLELSGPDNPRSWHFRSGTGGSCGPGDLDECDFAFSPQNPWAIRANATAAVGACCHFDGSCEDGLLEAECTGTGQVWTINATCDEVDCVAIPTVSEWALIVMTLIGCVAGTLVFRSRAGVSSPIA